MRTVNELNENELEELRESYFQELLDTSPDFIGDFENSSQIPMEDVKNHYEGISFVEDDFFCNLNK
jgi:hypothetical protein